MWKAAIQRPLGPSVSAGGKQLTRFRGPPASPKGLAADGTSKGVRKQAKSYRHFMSPTSFQTAPLRDVKLCAELHRAGKPVRLRAMSVKEMFGAFLSISVSRRNST